MTREKKEFLILYPPIAVLYLLGRLIATPSRLLARSLQPPPPRKSWTERIRASLN